MKVYECIIDDGMNVFKATTVSKDKSTMLKEYGGNGEFVKIKDVTKDYKINIDDVRSALTIDNFGKTEIDLIIRILETQKENLLEA